MLLYLFSGSEILHLRQSLCIPDHYFTKLVITEFNAEMRQWHKTLEWWWYVHTHLVIEGLDRTTHLSSWVVLRRAISPWHQRLVCNRLTESLDDSDRKMQPDRGFMYLNLLVGLGEELGVMPLSCDWNHWRRKKGKLQIWKPAGTSRIELNQFTPASQWNQREKANAVLQCATSLTSLEKCKFEMTKFNTAPKICSVDECRMPYLRWVFLPLTDWRNWYQTGRTGTDRQKERKPFF